ncbi:MAG: tRNA pseudouridine(55) synthase TruB [Candidatus Omnitrophica bacterium]|nr:tRNA pseudouridine(55) synthase TruB [Candidatus Omnitrophota bacterium]
METVNGILVVDKARDMTSHDVVAMVRKRFGFTKVGHAGTLDPAATGVLVLLIGKATKLSSRFLNDDKEYAATMRLGQRTDSGDAEGRTISSSGYDIPEKRVREVVLSFRGIIAQVPPMVSAKKRKGKKLYELARRGITVRREPVKVEIGEIEVTGISLPDVDFRTSCSKGTYIRQLADDIGQELGCGAHLKALRRLRSGGFTLERAVPVERLKTMEPEELNGCISRI